MFARSFFGVVAAVVVAGLAMPAAAQAIDFKTVPLLECKLSHVHMCGAADKCESGAGQHIVRFDMDKESVCTAAGSGPCEKDAKFAAYENDMLPGIVVIVQSNRSIFHVGPDGAMTGSQIAAGVVFNMIGKCVGKGS